MSQIVFFEKRLSSVFSKIAKASVEILRAVKVNIFAIEIR